MPFVYDVADLFKEYVSIDFSFWYVSIGGDVNDRRSIIEGVASRIVDAGLLDKVPPIFDELFEGL